MKKIICIILVLCALFSLPACSSKSSSDDGLELSSVSKTEAISAVKSSQYVRDKIAKSAGLKKILSISWGNCTATQQDNGWWSVSINGTVSGLKNNSTEDTVRDKAFSNKFSVDTYGNVIKQEAY